MLSKRVRFRSLASKHLNEIRRPETFISNLQYSKFFINILNEMKKNMEEKICKIIQLDASQIKFGNEISPNLLLPQGFFELFEETKLQDYSMKITSNKIGDIGTIVNMGYNDGTMINCNVSLKKECMGYLKELQEKGSQEEDLRLMIEPNLFLIDASIRTLNLIANDPSFIIDFKNFSVFRKLLNLPCSDIPLEMDKITYNLNKSQYNAVKRAVEKPLSIIVGPPGTGKTLVSCSIVEYIVKTSKKKILVTSSSNLGVDNIADNLHNLGIKVLRIYSEDNELKNQYKPYSLLYKINQLVAKGEVDPNFEGLHRFYRNIGYFHFEEDNQKYLEMREKFTLDEIEKADVICVTCQSSGKKIISQLKFDCVLIDEASQTLETDLIISINTTMDKLILVGDHKQLPAIVKDRKLREYFEPSFFEMLINMGIKPELLQEQFRMHPFLSKFPSMNYYGGLLLDHHSVHQMEPSKFYFPNRNKPVIFHANFTQEMYLENSFSIINIGEVDLVLKYLMELINQGVKPSSIGIITAYKDQIFMIRKYLSDMNVDPNILHDVQISTVHSFQGKETEYIIISCVRSNLSNSIGFLDDRKQLNVSITRSKKGMIIIGNPNLLSNNNSWGVYLDYLDRNDLIFTGEYPNLIPYKL